MQPDRTPPPIPYEQWKAMWDKCGPFPVITHADALLLLTEIARLEAEQLTPEALAVIAAAMHETQAERNPRSISRLETPAVTIHYAQRARRRTVDAYLASLERRATSTETAS